MSMSHKATLPEAYWATIFLTVYVLLLDSCRNVQTIILRILRDRYRKHFFVREPDEVHFVFRVHIQKLFGALESNSPVRLGQLLRASLFKTLEAKVIVNDTGHGRPGNAGLSGNLAYGTVSLWLVFLTQSQLLHS